MESINKKQQDKIEKQIETNCNLLEVEYQKGITFAKEEILKEMEKCNFVRCCKEGRNCLKELKDKIK